MAEVKCKTCDIGALQLRKKYRMSGVVVAIGYILLIPSILGILFSAFLFFAAGLAGSGTTSQIRERAASRLRDAEIPEPLVRKVIAGETVTPAEEDAAGLISEQIKTLRSEQQSISASTAGAGLGIAIAGGFAFFLGIASFVGGLLGWLLIMKKQILQCNHCGAVVAAS